MSRHGKRFLSGMSTAKLPLIARGGPPPSGILCRTRNIRVRMWQIHVRIMRAYSQPATVLGLALARSLVRTPARASSAHLSVCPPTCPPLQSFARSVIRASPVGDPLVPPSARSLVRSCPPVSDGMFACPFAHTPARLPSRFQKVILKLCTLTYDLCNIYGSRIVVFWNTMHVKDLSHKHGRRNGNRKDERQKAHTHTRTS